MISHARQTSARMAPHSAGIAAIAFVITLLIGFLLPAITIPKVAFASGTQIVAKDKNEPGESGYGYSFNFSSIEDYGSTQPAHGTFQRVDDIRPYEADLNKNDIYSESDAQWGWWASFDNDAWCRDENGILVSRETGEPISFALRYLGEENCWTGTSWRKTDMIVTFTDIKLMSDEDWTSTAGDPFWCAFGGHQLERGLAINPLWLPNDCMRTAAELDRFTNVGFYSLGVDELRIQMRFVSHDDGTSQPVRGHMTFTDLDQFQGIASKSSNIDIIEVWNKTLTWTQENPSPSTFPYLMENRTWKGPETTALFAGDTALSKTASSDAHDDAYQFGLAEAYFKTTDQEDAVDFCFCTSNQGRHVINHEATVFANPVSFLGITSEYVTTPPPEDPPDAPMEKTHTTAPARNEAGETVSYQIIQTLPIEGESTLRTGYRLKNFTMQDALAPYLSYVEESASAAIDGTPVDPSSYVVTYNQSDRNLQLTFQDAFLQTLSCEGQHVTLAFDATLTERAPDNTVRNEATVTLDWDPQADDDVIQLEEALTLDVEKVDDTGQGLAGAQLQLLSRDGSIIAEWQSETNAKHVTIPEEYRQDEEFILHEASAPDGFSIAADQIIANIPSDETSSSLGTVTMVDEKQADRLMVKKAANPAEGTTIRNGDIVTYTLQVTNMGNAEAHDVCVQDAIPVGCSYAPGSASPSGTYDQSSTLVQGSDLTIPPGSSETLSFCVNVGSVKGDLISNTAFATSRWDGITPPRIASNTVSHPFLPIVPTAADREHETYTTLIVLIALSTAASIAAIAIELHLRRSRR